MARVQRGGAAAYAWALVFFASAFVITLILAIIFGTRLSGAKNEAEQATAKLQKYVRGNDETRPVVTEMLGRGGESVVSQLLKEAAFAKQKLGVEEQASQEMIQNEFQRRGIEGAALPAIQRLKNDVDATKELLQAKEQVVRDLQDRLTAATQQRIALDNEFKASVKQLEQEVAGQKNMASDVKDRLSKMESELLKGFETQIGRKDQQINDLQDQVDVKTQEVVVLERELEKLRGERGASLVQKVTLPDGMVLSILPEENKVYLNRGKKDRVPLGITFEVYNAPTVVQLDSITNTLRGKATIEVINVDEDTSVARVVRRSRGAVIKEGDQILNIVYDPDKIYRFHVFGQFDIDYTGAPTVSDMKRIEGMVRDWGGILESELSYEVDYLVLGQEPPLPEQLSADEFDPVKLAENVEAKKRYETYQSLVKKADDLKIPVLNQNRFLDLVGYYER